MKWFLPFLLCAFGIIHSTNVNAQETLPFVPHGKIVRIQQFPSQFVAARNVDIWLPDGYNPASKYAVLYMHDGQMLYDTSTTWNHQAWDIDDIATELMRTKKVANFIVVGIWNNGSTRHSDYFPQEPYTSLSRSEKDTISAQLQRLGRTKQSFEPASDNYLKFIVEELKPHIDSAYSVYTNPSRTFICGSSMGGLISLYALCKYPDIFGGAACLSTHWIGTFTDTNNPIPQAFIDYFGRNLPDPRTHRIYLDCGDQTLDALYPKWQKKMDVQLVNRGYTETNWMTKYFPGDDHSERSWKKRLHLPVQFLFGNEQH
jgi:enterochelin esterase-like enzyme